MNFSNDNTAKKEKIKSKNIDSNRYNDINNELDIIMSNSSIQKGQTNKEENGNLSQSQNSLDLKLNKEKKEDCLKRLDLMQLINDDSLGYFFEYCPNKFFDGGVVNFTQNIPYIHLFSDEYRGNESIFQLLKDKNLNDLNNLKREDLNFNFGEEPSSVLSQLYSLKKKEQEKERNKFFDYINKLDKFFIKDSTIPIVSQRINNEIGINNFINEKNIVYENNKVYESSSSFAPSRSSNLCNIGSNLAFLEHNNNILRKPHFPENFLNKPIVSLQNIINEKNVGINIKKDKKKKKKKIQLCEKKKTKKPKKLKKKKPINNKKMKIKSNKK
jgi:hypothetical protein